LCHLQVERARKAARVDDSEQQPLDTQLKRSEDGEPLKLNLVAAAAAAKAAAAAAADNQQSRGTAAAAPALFGDDEGAPHLCMERGETLMHAPTTAASQLQL
jgi:hypothetical protein